LSAYACEYACVGVGMYGECECVHMLVINCIYFSIASVIVDVMYVFGGVGTDGLAADKDNAVWKFKYEIPGVTWHKLSTVVVYALVHVV